MKARVLHHESARVKQAGRLVSSTGDSATVELTEAPKGPLSDRLITGRVGDRVVVPLREVEVAWGERRQGVQGALIGAALGGVGGALIGQSIGDDCTDHTFCIAPKSETVPALGVLGVVVGALVGGFIGEQRRTDRWISATRLSPMPVSARMSARSRSVSIGIHLTY
jgi:hypothetical protein